MSVGEGGDGAGADEWKSAALSWCSAAHLAGEEVRSGEEGAEALHNHHSATTVDGRDLSLHNLVIRIHLRHAIPRLAEEDAPPREHLLTVLVLVESKGEERQGRFQLSRTRRRRE